MAKLVKVKNTALYGFSIPKYSLGFNPLEIKEVDSEIAKIIIKSNPSLKEVKGGK